MTGIHKYLLSSVVTVGAALSMAGCGSMEADRLEVDPDRFNVNDDSLDLVDPDRFNVDDDQLDLETDVD
jgi:hypothetical protein